MSFRVKLIPPQDGALGETEPAMEIGRGLIREAMLMLKTRARPRASQLKWKRNRRCIEMADDADRADERIQNMIDDGMARARRASERHLPATGFCHWCTSPTSPGRTFCSKECSDDHEHERLRKKANGL